MADSLRLLRLVEVRSRTGLSRSTIYRLAAEGRFPAPVKLTAHASAWREDEIEDFIASRPRAASSKVAA